MKVLFQVVSVLLFIASTVLYFYFNAQHRQAQRELIYKKAVQEVQRVRKERLQAHERRVQEAQLRREYNQGQVVGAVSLSN
ncbi:MAG: hypothetical protein IKL48_06170 [Elusimicrobiaceae bacterium]|nr:hypothetical protein [Elusimicrobiaceae bacterium]